MTDRRPVMVTLVSDVFFAERIESVASALGFEQHRVESGSALEPATEGGAAPRTPIGEPLSGPGAGFVAQMVEWQPAVIVVELASAAIPWPLWIAALKSSAATRRIPVLAFGPHTDTGLRQRALDVGCDKVVGNGRLMSALPEIIRPYARQSGADPPDPGCQGEPSALAREGLGLFERGAYFEAHEALEHAWNQAQGRERQLYQGVLQVAVAYLQIQRGNYRGALKMFLRLRQWLDPLPDWCRGVDVAGLRRDARAARAELERLGPGRLAEFDARLLRPAGWRRGAQDVGEADDG